MSRVLRGTVAVLALLAVVVATTASARPTGSEACLATNARFRTADGVKLAGAVIGRGATGVVFAHQVAGDRCQWLSFARDISHGFGYRSLLFDMRGYGASGGVANVSPHLDVAAAAAELRRRGARKIVLVGASMGGTGVVGAAPRIRPAVAGVVELSAPTGFGGVDALAAVRKLKRPGLFVAGRDDGDFAAATRALHRAATTKDKALVIAPTSWHGVDLVSLPRPRKAVLDFLARVGGR